MDAWQRVLDAEVYFPGRMPRHVPLLDRVAAMIARDRTRERSDRLERFVREFGPVSAPPESPNGSVFSAKA